MTKSVPTHIRCPDCGQLCATFKELMEHQKVCGSLDKKKSDAKQNFVHLHAHTEYSILDGVGQIKGMIEKAAKDGAKALAITDHGTVSGHVAFQYACTSSGVKPIFGCEFYTCENHLNKTNRIKNHLVLLAKNEVGYRNLIKLASIAATDGFYYKPRIDFGLLEKYHEGLICLSACIGGEIPQAILAEEIDYAYGTAEKFKKLFGEDFYLELQPNRLPEQKVVNGVLEELAKILKIELVATNDAHYPEKDDWKAHEIILCIKTHAKISDKNRFRFDDNTFYLMTEKEIFNAFKEHHSVSEETIKKAIENTLVVAEKCDYLIQKKDVVLPMFKLPDEIIDENEYLDFLAYQGFKKNYVDKKIHQYSENFQVSFESAKKVYIDRLEMELKVVHNLNFERYMLIVWEIYQFCKEKGIACGPGRGSVAGSLLAYTLGITTVDPIENGLYFGRFLTPERIDWPDIDMDFEDSRRHEVVQHLKDLYGEDKVANIVTYGRMKGKLILKDVARVFNVPYHEVNNITDFIVQRSGGDARVSFTVQDAIESFKEVKQFANKYPEVMKYAQKLEGQIRQKGVHAAGIVVSEISIEEVCPVELKDGKVVTSFDGPAAENAGLLKLDILGLRTMTIIKEVIENIKEQTGEVIKLEEISLNDNKVFEYITDGLTAGVFQLETKNMSRLCRQVKLDCFDDIVTINALGRPGTMRSGLASKYIRIKHKKEKPSYIHPVMKPITEPTYSIMLFQEQIMRVLADIGNFDWANVDIHRKIISKSQGTAAFEKARSRFIKGAFEKNGISEEIGNKLYTQMIQFGSYSFNKSHAAAYSTISYWCCWLKCHYPDEFFAAALSHSDGKEQEYIKEARKLEVKILPPDINESGFNFIPKNNKILGSLRGIKGLGDKGISAIIEHRPYKNFQDFLDKIPKGKVNKKSIEALIKIGTFGEKGAKTIYDNFVVGKSVYQKTLFDFEEEKIFVENWSPEEMEKFQSELYILPPIIHPIEKYKNLLKKLEISSEFNLIGELELSERKGETIWLRGIITSIKYQNWGDKLAEKPSPDHPMYKYFSKHEWNSRHCLFDLEDESHAILCTADPNIFEKYEHIINKGSGTPILVKAQIGFRMFDRIYIREIYDLNELDSCVKSGKLSKAQKALFENPLREYEHLKHIPLCDLDDYGTAIGIFGQPKLHIDKNGNEMAFIPFEDMTGSITIICFASDWVHKKGIIKDGVIAGINLRKMQSDGKSYSASKIVLLNPKV